MVFRTVPPANTLIRWVDERRLRPHSAGSTRPHLRPTGSSRGGPPRLRPGTSPHALRIPPRGGHPALRVPRGGSRSPLAVSGFRLRARVGFAIPSSPRPARRYPRVRIRRPSSGRRRDLNPPDHHAAQRTLRAYPPPCTAGPARRRVPVESHAPSPCGLPVLPADSPCIHAIAPTPAGPVERRRSGLDRRRPSPSVRRVGSRIARFEVCSAFTHVMACLLADPRTGPSPGVLQPKSLPP
jgi:hypothetical protein